MRQSDKVGGQDGEDVCLDERHEQFEAIHEDAEEDAYSGHRGTHPASHLSRHKHHAGQCQDDDMSCHDVGKETDSQREGFGEHANELDDGHDGQGCLEEDGHVWPEDALVVALGRKAVDGDESSDGAGHCHCDVACQVCSTREDGDES